MLASVEGMLEEHFLTFTYSVIAVAVDYFVIVISVYPLHFVLYFMSDLFNDYVLILF